MRVTYNKKDNLQEELKYIIINTYPIIFKGWDGKIIVDLIQAKYGVVYTRAGVYALLKSLGITYIQWLELKKDFNI